MILLIDSIPRSALDEVEMTAETPPAFGILLSRYRAAVGLTQEELAERAGLSVEAISALERGVRTRPRPVTVTQLAEALNLSPEDRAALERAARSTPASMPDVQAVPEGDYLGVRPRAALVAREEDCERIRAILDAAADGVGHLLLLSGETGVGKTRLLQETMLEAGAQGYVVLTGRCYARTTSPYSPFLEALPALAPQAPAGVRSEVQRGWKRIQQLAGGPTASAVEQQHLFSAVGDVLLLVARSVPVALLLDDVHWLDSVGLLLLQHLAHSTRHARVLLAATFHDLQLTETHPDLAQALVTWSRERLAERLVVRRLSLEETTQLVALTMGRPEVSEEFASFVYRRTKGNPRLIDQLVRSLGGRLELQGEIGAGAMGRVFRAYDRTLGATVAAKLVLARAEINLDTLLRFQQEGAVLARLEHPHIVRIYDTFVEEHATCIIMELLEGCSLGQLLHDGPLPLPRARHLALQVAEALAYAHLHGIVHRDIKPDNVMVLADDQVKVTDFGIARFLQPDTTLQTFATTGMRLGTPLYMAPEQIAGTNIDARTDVYALGALLYHMVTGRPPFEGSDALTVAVQHLQEEPAPPSMHNAAIPADWDALILRALQKDPARRFQSAKEMEAAVAALGEVPGTYRPKPTRRQWVAAAGGLLLAVLAALVVVTLHASIAAQPPSLNIQLDTYLRELAVHGQLSGTVLVARKGTILLERGYGLADRAQGIPNTPTTRYPVPGVSDSLSVLGTLRLIEQGLLSWQTPICAYLPHCPPTWRSITVRGVLDGTASLPDYYWGWPGHTTQQSIAGCQALPLGGLLGRPGGTISYWGCSTLVLGTLIEAAGQPWDMQVGAFVYRAASMQNSGRLTDAVAAGGIARDYMGTTVNTNTTYNDFFEIYATAHDVYAYDNALFDGRLLSRADMTTLLTPRAALGLADRGINDSGVGYLWQLGTAFGHRVIYTNAQLQDFHTVNMRFPDAGVTVVVISNDARNNGEDVAIHLAAQVFGQRVAPLPANRTPQPAALVGQYRRIFQAADAIAAHDPNQKAWAGGTIMMTIKKESIHFVVADGGTVDEYYTATADGGLSLLGYLPSNENSFCSDDPHLDPPAGSYHWTHWGNTLIITRLTFDPCLDRGAIMPGRWTKIR
jgi:CubicO group peptidase (beta-lactamase class C family)/transcriptional regulator with XRE-family HTH domain